MAIMAALYPPTHPYHWLTIGGADDLQAARLDDVKAFFQTYYHPRNASLTLAGDVSVSEGLSLAEKYFGELAPGEAPPPVEVPPPPPLDGEVRLVLEDRVELARLYLSWHSPGLFQPGDAELDLVADVLAGGKTSRLYRRLVYELRVATEVAASQNSREIGSFFQLVATAAPGRSLDELKRAIDAAIKTLLDEGPTVQEMERCLAQAETHFVFRLQTVGGFGGKGDQLNAYNVFLDDPGYFDRDLARYRDASPGSLQTAARRWLTRGHVALSVVPRGRPEMALADSQTVMVS